jgi:hypothetical protein
MNRWLRRLLYALVVLVWLLLVIAPLLAFVLAARGQIQFGSDPRRHLRLFLVQEEDAQGIGLEWLRPSRSQSACSSGSLTYFMWEGEGQNASFCQCYEPITNELDSVAPQACQSP